MDTERPREHWENVYSKKETDELTWYQERPDTSLELIDTALGEQADGGPGERSQAVRLIDVGAGASTLEDYLAGREDFRVTAVDIAPSALRRTRERLRAKAGESAVEGVRWRVADITEPLEWLGDFDLWHDRAVFHFLTDAPEREAYRQNLQRAVPSGGHAVISTFSPEGPEKCSGLTVCRYSAEALSEELGPDWKLLESRREDHPTPWGGTQNFMYGLFRRV